MSWSSMARRYDLASYSKYPSGEGVGGEDGWFVRSDGGWSAVVQYSI